MVVERQVRRAVHGAVDESELRALGVDPAKVLDFSASLNPSGASPAVRRALRRVDPAAYPDRHAAPVGRALSAKLGLAPEQILCGNGSSELIHLLAHSQVGPSENVVILGPTFGEYQTAAELAGGRVVEIRAEQGQQFRWDLEAAERELQRARPRLVFLCNPNNPTGVYLDRGTVERLIEASAPGVFVIDEAYRPFVDEPWESLPLLPHRNVVLLRSMTKEHGLAGLRLGYILGEPGVIERVRSYQPAWSVNSAAQAAGVAALNDDSWLEKSRAVVAKGKAYLMRQVERRGMNVSPAAANFLLIEVGAAARWRNRLLEQGVLVRDCTSFGLPDHIRVGVRRLADCRRLIAALDAVRPHPDLPHQHREEVGRGGSL